MKKIILPLIAIMLLAMPGLAVPENIMLGPYQVSFDAGKERQEWNITEEESETYDGMPYVTYKASSELVKIGITHYSNSFQNDQINLNLKYRIERVKELAKSLGWFCETSERTIDKHKGFVATIGLTWRFAQWWSTNDTLVGFDSFYPWDSGTLQLLKTIHIEKLEEPAP